MTVFDFIANQPDTEKVVVKCEHESFRMTIADLKAADENRFYLVDSWTWSKDTETWFFAVDSGYPGMPDDISSEYLVLDIHDSRL